MATGDRAIVSDAVTGGGAAFVQPRGIVVDAAGQTAYVADQNTVAVIAVDLGTGDRTVVSDNTGTGAGTSFSNPSRLALDEANGRMFVIDRGDRILGVDLVTGNRAPLSDPATGAGPHFDQVADLVYDASRDRLLATDDGLAAVFEVDGQSGDRALVQQVLPGSEQGYVFATDLAHDAGNDRVLLAVGGAPFLLSVNLADGTLGRGDGISVGAGIPYHLSTATRKYPPSRVRPANRRRRCSSVRYARYLPLFAPCPRSAGLPGPGRYFRGAVLSIAPSSMPFRRRPSGFARARRPVDFPLYAFPPAAPFVNERRTVSAAPP